MLNLKSVRGVPTIAIASFLLGALMGAGGIFVLLKLGDSLSLTEIRLLIGVSLLIFGMFFFQISDTKYLRARIEALEKRLEKSESDS